MLYYFYVKMSKDRLQRRGLIKSDMAKKRSIKKTKEEKKRNLEEFSFFFVSVRGFVCCNENWILGQGINCQQMMFYSISVN